LLAELGDLDVKIKDIVNEVFGTRRKRDKFGTDYEKDPETGEYTGSTETNPRSFTNMIKGVADRLGADSGSQWVKAPDDNLPDKVKRYRVPPGRVLVVQSRNGRNFFKYAAKPTATDKTGFWTDSEGNTILDSETIKTLEKLAQENGQLTFDPNTTQNAQSAEPGAEAPINDEPVGEPSTSEPLHPDVAIVQSVPLVIQYKGKRFEMDDYGEFHPFGTTRKVTPALQTFLAKERMKL
jgi:hypothetical protein